MDSDDWKWCIKDEKQTKRIYFLSVKNISFSIGFVFVPITYSICCSFSLLRIRHWFVVISMRWKWSVARTVAAYSLHSKHSVISVVYTKHTFYDRPAHIKWTTISAASPPLSLANTHFNLIRYTFYTITVEHWCRTIAHNHLSSPHTHQMNYTRYWTRTLNHWTHTHTRTLRSYLQFVNKTQRDWTRHR